MPPRTPSKSRVRRAADVEGKVRSWLVRSGTTVLDPQSLRKAAAGEQDPLNYIDFLVTKPFPLAIEVKGSVTALPLSAKRLLSTRILLAESFGPDLPFVVVAADGVGRPTSRTQLPFVDRVLFASRLPILADLANVQVRRDFRTIFSLGDPGPVQFSSATQVTSDWSRPCTLEDFLGRVRVADRVLGAELRRSLVSQLSPDASESRDSTRADFAGLTHGTYFALVGKLQGEFSRHLEEKAGLRVIGKTHPGTGLGQLTELRSAAGSILAVDLLFTSPGSLSSKVRELVARAWLLRAMKSPSPVVPVLVLALLGGTSGEDGVPNSPAPSLANLNALESAGWRVLPFDLGHPQSQLLARLEELARCP